jgi:hypothetical protein
MSDREDRVAAGRPIAIWPPTLEPGGDGGLIDRRSLPDAAEQAELMKAGARLAEVGGTSAAELIESIIGGLDLPGWVGHNWDAIHELLRFPEPDDGQAIVLIWRDPEAIPDGDRAIARSVFADAARWRVANGRRPLIVVAEAAAKEG